MDERFKDYEVTADGKMVSAVPKGGGPKFPLPIGERAQADRALLGYALGNWDFVFKDQSKLSPVPKSGPPPVSLSKEDMFDKVATPQTLRKDRIAWVEGSSAAGGAEISGRLVRKVGEQCGFSIELLNNESDTGYMSKTMGDSDLIVLNNLFGLTDLQMLAVVEAIKTKKYAKYEHDHREIERPEFSKGLFQNSVLNVFLSPVHLENHMEALGCEGIALPLAIDVDFFQPVENDLRKQNTALVCNVRNFKTWDKLQTYINEHGETDFTVLTNDALPVSGMHVRGEPLHSYEDMRQVYAGYEYVVHLLDGWGAGERVLFEGALCGCKIITDEKAGHTSWGREFIDSPELRSWLGKAPFDFWREISKII